MEERTFESLNLRPELLKGIYLHGFLSPTQGQIVGIPAILSGRDLILQAAAGTGKTAIFAIAGLEKVDPSVQGPQVLVISPTRELAEQTQKVFQSIGAYSAVGVHLCSGGRSMEEDRRVLGLGTGIVSGTPGRVFDMVVRKVLQTDRLKMVVLDEADELLRNEFRRQLHALFTHLPRVQLVFVSATLPKDVLSLAEKIMQNPLRVLLPRDQLSLDGVRQFFVIIDSDNLKFETLLDLFDSLAATQTAIFCNSKPRVTRLSSALRAEGLSVCSLSSDLVQKERSALLSEFRRGNFRLLVSTDLLSRGIDVQEVSLVLNFDFPTSRETYIHRIGRSGRFGRKGVAISFVLEEEVENLRAVEQFYATEIEELPANLEELL